VLGITAEAEDAAQEALMRAWSKRDACEAEHPAAWVRTIARREALRIAVRRGERPLEEAPEPAASEEDDVLLRASVRAAVAELEPADRRLVLGSYWEDLSGAELGRRLGYEETTVRVRLHRTRVRLRRVLT